MADWVQKELSGSLFVNDRKEKDTHPDWTGTCLIDGQEYWISAWVKTGQRGEFKSLAFKKKEPRQNNGGSQQRQSQSSQQNRPAQQRQQEPQEQYSDVGGQQGDEVPF